MKYITKPKPLTIGGRPFGLEDFARFLITSSAHFNRTGPGIRAGLRIEDAFTRDAEKSYVELTPDHWQVLHEAAENPTEGFPVARGTSGDGKPLEVSLARDCLVFVDAIASAKDEPPITLTAADNAAA